MPLSSNKKNAALNGAFATGSTVYISLHTGSPATLANEFTGGTYGRQPATVPDAVAGVKTFAPAIPGTPIATINSSGQTVATIGVCSSQTVGTVDAYYDCADVITQAGDKIDVNALAISAEDIAGK